MANVECIWDLEEEAMSEKRRKTAQRTPEQRTQHQAIREAFRDWHPGPES